MARPAADGPLPAGVGGVSGRGVRQRPDGPQPAAAEGTAGALAESAAFAEVGLFPQSTSVQQWSDTAQESRPQWVIQGTEGQLNTLRQQLAAAGIRLIEEQYDMPGRRGGSGAPAMPLLNVIVMMEENAAAAPAAPVADPTVAPASGSAPGP